MAMASQTCYMRWLLFISQGGGFISEAVYLSGILFHCGFISYLKLSKGNFSSFFFKFPNFMLYAKKVLKTNRIIPKQKMKKNIANPETPKCPRCILALLWGDLSASHLEIQRKLFWCLFMCLFMWLCFLKTILEISLIYWARRHQ